jgi:hypothetical protein
MSKNPVIPRIYRRVNDTNVYVMCGKFNVIRRLQELRSLVKLFRSDCIADNPLKKFL